MVIQTSKTANIIMATFFGIICFLMFYESCYNSKKEQNSWNTYKENTSYYISGQIFKIIEISGNRYCIFVKTDSVDIKKYHQIYIIFLESMIKRIILLF